MSICFSAIVEGLLAAAKASTHIQSPDGVVLVRKGGSWSLWVVESNRELVPSAPAHATGITPFDAAKALIFAGSETQTAKAELANHHALSSRLNAQDLNALYRSMQGRS